MFRVVWILSLALSIGAGEPSRVNLETLALWAEYLPYPSSTASPVDEPGTVDDDDDDDFDADAPFTRIYPQVGPLIGIPGEDFPDYTDFPPTSFSCADQDYVPGYYADLESRCQVFHACWPDQETSFLCHLGKIFNQKLLVCDYWYNSNCSLAPHYYSVNGDLKKFPTKEAAQEQLDRLVKDRSKMALILQFLPKKAKVTIYESTSDSKSKIAATTSDGRRKRHILTTESQDFSQKPQSTTGSIVTEEAQYSTQSPECPDTKYIDVEAAVKSVFDRLDNVLKNTIKEVRENISADKKICSNAHTDKISVLTKIQHKLVQRPLQPPIVEEEESVSTLKTDAAVDPTVTKPPVEDRHKKPVGSRVKRSRSVISPLTKEALIASYINLLKLRKG